MPKLKTQKIKGSFHTFTHTQIWVWVTILIPHTQTQNCIWNPKIVYIEYGYWIRVSYQYHYLIPNTKFFGYHTHTHTLTKTNTYFFCVLVMGIYPNPYFFMCECMVGLDKCWFFNIQTLNIKHSKSHSKHFTCILNVNELLPAFKKLRLFLANILQLFIFIKTSFTIRFHYIICISVSFSTTFCIYK